MEFKLPTETVDLPSKGLLYSEDNPLSSGQVEIKYMTAKEEDILSNQAYIQKGIVLDKLIESGNLHKKTKIFKKNIYTGIFIILKMLHKLKIVHRDIRPQNIIIKNDGTPILIDFQFAVDIKRKKYKEFEFVKKHPGVMLGLGDKFVKNILHWDDAYSVSKIFNLFKLNDDKIFIQIAFYLVFI